MVKREKEKLDTDSTFVKTMVDRSHGLTLILFINTND